MVLQDALVTLPHNRYGEYLEVVYRRMASHVPPDADVVEIGVRHDRGVISKRIIPHRQFTTVDKDRRRGEIAADVRKSHIHADVILSTCLLHHTAEVEIPLVLDHLHAPLLMFSGPNIEAMPKLFGDHEWHIEIDKLTNWLVDRGYAVEWDRIGLSEPLSEILVIAQC